MPHRSKAIPKYVDEIPEALATLDQLKARGLQPGTPCPVALVELNTKDSQRLTGLYRIEDARPAEVSA